MSNALNELIEIISDFTPEQMKQFLTDPVVTSILCSQAENIKEDKKQ